MSKRRDVERMTGMKACAAEDRLTGVLLGTALGDALGLPCEGMKAAAIRRRFGTVDRFHLLGRTGFVSDDTEQAALVAHSLLEHPEDAKACAAAFRRHLLRWFLRLPFGVGLATVRACARIALGARVSGVASAGNGAAMRAPVIGAYFAYEADRRREFGRAIAEVTHRDERAVEGALYVAEMTAACCRGEAPQERFASARAVIHDSSLAAALDRANLMAGNEVSPKEAARELGTSGFVLHTTAFATFCFQRDDHAGPLEVLSAAIGAGGDTDTIGAILGAWLGASHGSHALPAALLEQIHDGPFGPTHLRTLAIALSHRQSGQAADPPRYSSALALLRNLSLYPVVIGHGLRRLLP